MTFPNNSSCVICLKMYWHGAGSQGDVTRVVALNPWVLLGIYPVLPWEKGQIWLPCKLVSKLPPLLQSLHIGLKVGLMPSCVHTLETPCVQNGSLCVCVLHTQKPLNSHSKVKNGRSHLQHGENRWKILCPVTEAWSSSNPDPNILALNLTVCAPEV